MHAFSISQLGFNLTERFYGILIMKFDRSGSGDIRFDDFIQCCVVLQVIAWCDRIARKAH